MTVLAQMLQPNDSIGAWWPDLAAANDDGTCAAVGTSTPACAGAGGDAAPCDADDGPRAPTAPWTMSDPQRHPTSASASGCPTYQLNHGDLWADVLEYRGIRAQSLGGARLSTGQRERLDELECRLRGRTDDARRQFLRFPCHYHATIELSRGERFPADVLDASAGGAKVSCPGDAHEGDPVVLELEAEGLVGSVVLPARIIWVRPGFVGLMFAGAPRWR